MLRTTKLFSSSPLSLGSYFRLRRLSGLLLSGLVSAAAFANGISVTVDRDEVTIEDQIALSVTVEGSRDAVPTLPDLSAFEVVSRGQSSRMSFSNGRASSSVVRQYVLIPKSKGTCYIGPATVELDGALYSSKPFQVRVHNATTRPDKSRDLYITSRVSTTTPYVGQQVVYIWRFFRKVRIGDARLEPQDYGGFLVEELGDLKEYRTQVGGVTYVVSEYRKALFPQEVGELIVPSSQLTCQIVVETGTPQRSLFDGFFGRTTTATRILRSREIKLTVRPRPAPPKDYSGRVGTFFLSASLSRRELKVGESTTLKLKVSGSGNAQMISEPSFPHLQSFKVYADKPDGSLQRSDSGLSGTQTFSKALVPLKAGALSVPPINLVYFDPEAGSYRTARTESIGLIVLPSDDVEELRLTESVAPNRGKVAVRILADDILPSYRRVDAVRPPQGVLARALPSAGLLAPPILFLCALGLDRRRRRHRLDATIQCRRGALARAKRTLKAIRNSSSGGADLAVATQTSSC
ncbi:MAG: BatD family protein, partial [Thermoanaerobaculia bacterium]